MSERRRNESRCDWLHRLKENGERDKLFVAIDMMLWHGRIDGLPVVSSSRSVQAHYIAMRLDGTAHGLAEMLALGAPPMANTDREFLEGHCNGNQFEKTPELGNYYAKVASRHGQNVKGKIYLSGLAEFPGDPRAWVSDRNEVTKVLAERGWGAEGAVNRPVSKVAQPMNKAVADDIVEDAVDDLLEANPDARREDLVEKVTDTLKPHWTD